MGSAPKANDLEDSAQKLSIIVSLKDQQLCSPQDIPKSRSSDPQAVEISSKMKSLQEHAHRTQKGVLDLLETKKGSKTFAYDKIEKLWIVNAISISGASLSDIRTALEGHPDVLSVHEEEILTITGEPGGAEGQLRVATDYDSIIPHHWGVQEIGAPEVWAQGYNGSGIIVGQIDTGVYVSHEVLADSFRKDYGWFDPHNYTAEPMASNSHGTHVFGIAVGRKGIGVAPGARYIACLGCGPSCTERALLGCAQWMYCPTDTNGMNPDCSKRPHVVIMGVSGSQKAGNEGYMTRFAAAVDCWRLAGIIPVAGIGNGGPTCESAAFPGVLNSIIGVGNLERLVVNNGTKIRTKRKNKTIKNYCRGHHPHFLRCFNTSSRGPPLSKFNGTTKPDVSAPGTRIASAVRNNRYDLYTGASIATPHVAGIVALMLQKDPSLTFDAIKEILISTAIHPANVSEANSQCDGVPETKFPNNCVGHGLVHALKAVNRVTKKN